MDEEISNLYFLLFILNKRVFFNLLLYHFLLNIKYKLIYNVLLLSLLKRIFNLEN